MSIVSLSYNLTWGGGVISPFNLHTITIGQTSQKFKNYIKDIMEMAKFSECEILWEFVSHYNI